MKDVFVQMLLELRGKEMRTREVLVGGMLSGILVQRELVVIGKVRYDGALVARLKILADKKLPFVIREQGVVGEGLLYEGLFVGWGEKQGLEDNYFSYLGQGMIYVCKLYEELTTANFKHPEIIATIYKVTDSRVAELRKMV